MAKIVLARIFSLTYSTTARAMLIPSKVLVPRPISSRIIRLRDVACFKICDTSFISSMKVDWPVARSSLAPTRVKIRSTGEMLASFAGMNEPACAISVNKATCRIYVDFPAILGPVRIITSHSAGSRNVSLGTKSSPDNSRSTTG